jgi:hypothetical protein
MLKPYREIEKMIEPVKKLQNQMAATSLALQKSFENINKIYGSVPKFENPFLEHLDIFKKLGEALKEYTEKTPEYFLLIAQNGWYIDLECELNFPAKVAYKFECEETEIANQLLVEYYKENLDSIFKKLVDRHPSRKKILSQLLRTHKTKNYSVTIPALLTQIDGICFDFTKKKFFIKEKNNKFLPEVTSELEKSAASFLNLYLSPLQNQTPIMVREQDIHKFPCHLNRHEILHGISTNYGTEINSLKVISLLKYVSDLLTDLDRKNTAHNSG